MIKTLFFDVDGTLYDETHAKIKAEVEVTRQLCKITGLAYTDMWDIYTEGKNAVMYFSDEDPAANDRIGWYAATLGLYPVPGITAEELAARYWDVVYANIEPYRDLLEALPILSERYDLHIITDEFYDIQLEKLRRLGLFGNFGSITASDRAGVMKPHADIFRSALEQTGAKAGESFMVGDNPRKDIKGAKALGMGTALLKRGRFFFYDAPPKETADIIFTHFTDLPRYLERITGQ